MRSSSATTALTPTSHFGGRALLSVPNSGQQDRSLSSPARRNSKRALIPGSVSTGLSNLNHYLEKTIQAATMERKPHHNSSTSVNSSLVSSMCSCPAPNVANVTAMKQYVFLWASTNQYILHSGWLCITSRPSLFFFCFLEKYSLLIVYVFIALFPSHVQISFTWLIERLHKYMYCIYVWMCTSFSATYISWF